MGYQPSWHNGPPLTNGADRFASGPRMPRMSVIETPGQPQASVQVIPPLGEIPALILQSRLRSRCLKASPVVALHGSGLVPPSPSRPVDGQGRTATGQPQQPA